MADIHVLDARRDAAQVARLTADLAKLFDDGTEEVSSDRIHLRTEAARLHKQAAALHYILLHLQLEMDNLTSNTAIAPSEKKGILDAANKLSVFAEHLIKSIQRLPIRPETQNS